MVGPISASFPDLQTDTVDRNQVSPAQMWVLLLGQLIFLVWLMVLRRVQVSPLTLPLTLLGRFKGTLCFEAPLHQLFQSSITIPA